MINKGEWIDIISGEKPFEFEAIKHQTIMVELLISDGSNIECYPEDVESWERVNAYRIIESFSPPFALAMKDHINPDHYKSHASGVECIEVTRHENFNCGNAMKYIWRRNDKGNPIQDLKKAIWYLEDEVKRLENEEEDAQ